MKNVALRPWVGKNYQQGIQGKKILALGESHYANHPCSENFTTKVIADDFLNPEVEREGWMNTYTKFERAMVGHELSQEERVKFWNSIVFYNYIQEPLGGARLAPTKEQYAAAEKAFTEVLEEFRPDGVIVWSKRLYNALPPLNGKQGKYVVVEMEKVETWEYFLNDGHKVSLLPIYHPSSGFSWENWHPVINRFIECC